MSSSVLKVSATSSRCFTLVVVLGSDLSITPPTILRNTSMCKTHSLTVKNNPDVPMSLAASGNGALHRWRDVLQAAEC